MGLFFSKVAIITFGGAYAVLAYVAREGVARGWLKPEEMLDGLGMAETTPGPLIQVVQFVGFMGAYRNPPGTLPHWWLPSSLRASPVGSHLFLLVSGSFSARLTIEAFGIQGVQEVKIFRK